MKRSQVNYTISSAIERSPAKTKMEQGSYTIFPESLSKKDIRSKKINRDPLAGLVVIPFATRVRLSLKR
jgi:hypothetical protein